MALQQAEGQSFEELVEKCVAPLGVRDLVALAAQLVDYSMMPSHLEVAQMLDQLFER